MNKYLVIGLALILILTGSWYINRTNINPTPVVTQPEITLGSQSSSTETLKIQQTVKTQPIRPATPAPKPEIVNVADINTGATNFNGSIQEAVRPKDGETPKELLFQQFGVWAYSAFETHPVVVTSLQELYPAFNQTDIGVSQLNSIVTINGRSLLVLQGCYSQSCESTQQLVAIEPSAHRVYFLRPTNDFKTPSSGKYNLYGNPDKEVRAAMFKMMAPNLTQ